MQTKTEYIDGATQQLDLWGNQFASLEESLSKTAASGHSELRAKLETLKKKKRSLKRRLREAAHGSTATDWDDVRAPLKAAVAEFRTLAIAVANKVEGV